MYISNKDVEYQLSRMYQNNSKRQAAVNYEDDDELIENKIDNLTGNKNSLTSKIKSSAIDYFYNHPITVTSNVSGVIGAAIGGASGFILGSLALVSAPVSIPIGIGHRSSSCNVNSSKINL